MQNFMDTVKEYSKEKNINMDNCKFYTVIDSIKEYYKELEIEFRNVGYSETFCDIRVRELTVDLADAYSYIEECKNGKSSDKIRKSMHQIVVNYKNSFDTFKRFRQQQKEIGISIAKKLLSPYYEELQQEFDNVKTMETYSDVKVKEITAKIVDFCANNIKISTEDMNKIEEEMKKTIEDFRKSFDFHVWNREQTKKLDIIEKFYANPSDEELTTAFLATEF